MEPTDLCVPIYLNQQIVFDLLAILDDGFSEFSTIRSLNAEIQSQCAGTTGSVGLSNVFALIGLSLKGDLSKKKEGQEQKEISQQKIHTPASLFAKLKLMLDENNIGMLNQIDSREDINELNGGDFVYFRAILKKNPLIDALESLKKLMELAILFTDKGSEQKVKKGQRIVDPHINDPPVMKLLDGLLASLTQSNSLELIGELLDVPETKAVISTKLNYFSDKNAAEIIDGEFRVIGKVVRIIKNDSDTPVNLLRKTSFGLLDSKILNQFKDAFVGVENAGIKVPELVTEIKGPAIVVIPIAIFT